MRVPLSAPLRSARRRVLCRVAFTAVCNAARLLVPAMSPNEADIHADAEHVRSER
jgi:hypothetical protein